MLDTDKKVLTVEDLSKLLGIGMTSCYTLVKEGQFHTVRVGRKILIPKESVESWLRGDSSKAAAGM